MIAISLREILDMSLIPKEFFLEKLHKFNLYE